MDNTPCFGGAVIISERRAATRLLQDGLEAMADDFHVRSHRAHERAYESEQHTRFASTWTHDDTVDWWRHARMHSCLEPLLEAYPGARWVTIGDGRYGTDAHYLLQHGAKALATDISETMLRRAKAEGFITEYKKENAEQLSFADNSFDFALCKEAYHHMPRPMMAVYEMLRVARRAVVFIEPDQTPTLVNPRRVLKMLVKELLIQLGFSRLFKKRSTAIIDFGIDWYEEAGNYGFCISRRELERVALGLDYPHVAFRGFNDAYVAGVEEEKAVESSELFNRIRAEIEQKDRRCKRGLSLAYPEYLVAIIFKQAIDDGLRSALVTAGYDVIDLQRNPHLTKGLEPAG